MTDPLWIRNSLAVTRTAPQELHVLTTVYPEADALNAGGQLLCHIADSEGLTQSVLSTARPLAAMWRSPRKNLWLGSSDGYVWTTANLPWNKTENETFIEGTRWNWVSTPLPELEGKSRKPNITAIWGTSDSNVFFTTASGAIYRWDGYGWRVSVVVRGDSLTKIHGVSPNNAYAIGYGATIAHWDGETWRRFDTPGLDAAITIITGIAVQKSGNAYAVTNRGQVLARQGAQFIVVDRADAWFSGLVAWKGVLAASSATGAWLYSVGGGLRAIKDNFAATDVMVVQNELHFIESDQFKGPAVIEYKAKRAENAWQRLIF